MAFSLDPGTAAGEALRWIVVDRLVDALVALGSVGTGDSAAEANAMFVARKRCKQARAAATLLPSSVGRKRRRFDREVRRATRRLGPIRDAAVVHETLNDLDDRVELPGIDTASETSLRAAADAQQHLVRAIRLALRWPTDVVLDETVLRDSYRIARRAMQRAQAHPTADNFHDWRKATKTLWYQLRLTRRYNQGAISPLLGPLDELGRTLGSEHDLTVAIAALPTRQGVRGDAKRQRKAIRAEAFSQGQLIFAPKPKAFDRLVGTQPS